MNPGEVYSYFFDRQEVLLDMMNTSYTKREHREYQLRLFELRVVAKDIGIEGLCLAGDLVYINRGIDKPMCAGEWLDWEPQQVE